MAVIRAVAKAADSPECVEAVGRDQCEAVSRSRRTTLGPMLSNSLGHSSGHSLGHPLSRPLDPTT